LSTIPVVVGLLLRDDRVLMCQRPTTKIYPLHWEFPGGKVESGESLEAALARELFEELHAKIGESEQWFYETASYDNGLTYGITYFLIWEFSPEPENVEFNAIHWFSRGELPDALHLTGNKSILERIYREGFPA
jgi:8-oxo-dGTP diphosphatase